MQVDRDPCVVWEWSLSLVWRLRALSHKYGAPVGRLAVVTPFALCLHPESTRDLRAPTVEALLTRCALRPSPPLPTPPPSLSASHITPPGCRVKSAVSSSTSFGGLPTVMDYTMSAKDEDVVDSNFLHDR